MVRQAGSSIQSIISHHIHGGSSWWRLFRTHFISLLVVARSSLQGGAQSQDFNYLSSRFKDDYVRFMTP